MKRSFRKTPRAPAISAPCSASRRVTGLIHENMRPPFKKSALHVKPPLVGITGGSSRAPTSPKSPQKRPQFTTAPLYAPPPVTKRPIHQRHPMSRSQVSNQTVAEAEAQAETDRLARLRLRRERMEATQVALIEARTNPTVKREQMELLHREAEQQHIQRRLARASDAEMHALEEATMQLDAARIQACEDMRERNRRLAMQDVGRANLEMLEAKREEAKRARQHEIELERQLLSSPIRHGGGSW